MENHSKEMRIKETEYGAVRVIAGANKGRIGIYDDDDYGTRKTKASVSFGSFLASEKEASISFEHLSTVTTKALIDRTNEIIIEIREHKDDIYFKYDRMCELNLCSTLLTERYINARERMKNQEDHCVFISHASRDICIARALATDLINDGFPVFLDDWSVDLGENVISHISDAILGSHSLIMLISKDYLKSTYCSDEWTSFYMKYRKTKNNSIYPIIIDESDPPALLSAIKYARTNGMDNYQEAYDALLHAISNRLS